MLKEELSKISDMHDTKNPIPGIIYNVGDGTRHQLIKAITLKFSQNLKQQKFDKKELALLITSIINELDLTQEDFQNLKKDLDQENDDEEDEDEEDEF
jgi:uncharacterized protein YwgA